ncbi:MAG: creatininase family protein [Chloroflexota bacterium]
MERKVLWAEMRRPELEEAQKAGAAVIVPVGSIEQHGPHLPVDTDTSIVTAIAVGVAQSLAEPRVLVTPTVCFGLSPHHMGFTGTITLRFDTLVNVVCDICRSIHTHGFRKILILNGHGGNSALLNAVPVRLLEEGIHVASLTYWTAITSELREIGQSPLGGISHSGEMETSAQLYLRSHLVDLPSAVAEPVVPLTSLSPYDFRAPGAVSYQIDLREVTKHGVRGDPSYATPETGEQVIAAAVAKIGQFMREFVALG